MQVSCHQRLFLEDSSAELMDRIVTVIGEKISDR
jgi:hypothetical protein